MLLLLLTMLALVEATRGPVLGMESLPALKEAGMTLVVPQCGGNSMQHLGVAEVPYFHSGKLGRRVEDV
jgi:hypothetical protein